VACLYFNNSNGSAFDEYDIRFKARRAPICCNNREALFFEVVPGDALTPSPNRVVLS
jgi:hypothetical protein